MKKVQVRQRDIAKKAGVSVNTVSLALRESPRLKASTRAHVKQVAEELGYRPDPALSALMAKVRSQVHTEVGGVLQAISCMPEEVFMRWEGIRLLWKGCELRCRELGYRLERTHLSVTERHMHRLKRQLNARGIPGVLLFGPLWPEAAAALKLIVEAWPVVSVGVQLEHLPVHWTASDHFRGTQLAMQHIRDAGFQRPGLVLKKEFDLARSKSISGAYFAEIRDFSKSNQIDPLMDWENATFEARLLTWWKKWQPDVILTNQKRYSLAQWRDWNPTEKPVEFVQLGHTSETPDWAGVSYPGEAVGRAAVDVVVAQIHRGEFGFPRFQKCSMSEGEWVEEADAAS